jgi:hypothetical protein
LVGGQVATLLEPSSGTKSIRNAAADQSTLKESGVALSNMLADRSVVRGEAMVVISTNLVSAIGRCVVKSELTLLR